MRKDMKNDARVRYTRKMIEESFLTLLQTKTVNRITVKEICEMAQINRATFYKHYADPYDLLEQIEDKIIEGLSVYTQEEFRKNHGDFLLWILREMQKHGVEYVKMYYLYNDPGMSDRIGELMYGKYMPQMAERLPGLDPKQQQMVYHFLARGCGSMIHDWVNGGMKESPEEIARLIREIGDGAMEALREFKSV